MSDTSTTLRRAVREAARRWRYPEHPERAEAVAATLEAPNRFTKESLTYLLNAEMTALRKGLKGEGGEADGVDGTVVAVVASGRDPLGGLRDVLGALLEGAEVRLVVPASSPALVPAFLEAVREAGGSFRFEVTSLPDALDGADALLATPTDEDHRQQLEEAAASAGLAEERRLVRPVRFGAAVLTGEESEDDLEDLALDVLLLDGQHPQSIAVLWAPDDLAPDAFFDTLAQVRATLPVHDDTPGTLQMQQAFLAAQDRPHGYGEGLEFLVSKGDPEPQRAGHLRWAGYEELGDVEVWLEAEAKRLSLVASRGQLGVPEGVPRPSLGSAHRLPWGHAREDGERRRLLRTLVS